MTVQELIDKLKELNPELPVLMEFEDTLFKLYSVLRVKTDDHLKEFVRLLPL